MTDLLYSFATESPRGDRPPQLSRTDLAALPQRPDGSIVDLAAIDILRNRERGVPRYNEFRRQFRPQAGEVIRGLQRRPGIVRSSRRVYATPGDVDLHHRPLHRTQAPKVRVQRHRLPRFHPDGIPTAQERSLLHVRLPTRRLHPRGSRLDRRPTRWRRSSCATIPISAGLVRLDNVFKPWHVATVNRLTAATSIVVASQEAFWNLLSRLKFSATKRSRCPGPPTILVLSPRPRSHERYPDIPISSVCVADHVPDDETTEGAGSSACSKRG